MEVMKYCIKVATNSSKYKAVYLIEKEKKADEVREIFANPIWGRKSI